MNNTSDTLDVAPGNGVCADGLGDCTLRAAIMEANALPGADVIHVPAGDYVLTIPIAGEQFWGSPHPLAWVATEGDLDILDALTIVGAGADQTFIGWPTAPPPPGMLASWLGWLGPGLEPQLSSTDLASVFRFPHRETPAGSAVPSSA